MRLKPRQPWIVPAEGSDGAYRCQRCGDVLCYRDGETLVEYRNRRGRWMIVHDHDKQAGQGQ